MNDTKEIAFSIVINGVSNEATELQKLNLQIINLNKEYKTLQTTIKDQGGLASNQQLQQLAAYRRELDSQTASQKELKKVVDSAPDSLSRMRAELINLKNEYANASAEVRERMTPGIVKLSGEISKAEQAIGVHSRGVGNYKQSILDAGKQLIGFSGAVAATVLVLNKLKDAFFATEAGSKIMERVAQSTSTFFGLLSQGKVYDAFFGGQVANAQKLADKLDELRIAERSEQLENTKDQTVINELRIKAAEATKDQKKQVELLTNAQILEEGIIQRKKAHLEEEIAVYKDLNANNPNNTKLLDIQNAKEIEYEKLTGDRSLRIASKRQAAIDKVAAGEVKTEKEKNDALLLAEDDFEKEYNDIEEEGLKKKKDQKEAQLLEENDFWKLAVEIDREGVAKKKAILQQEFEEEKKTERLKLLNYKESQDAKINIARSTGNLLNILAGKNKDLQKVAMVAEKGLAIGEVVIATARANSILRANAAASVLPGPLYIPRLIAAEALVTPAIMLNRINAAINIAEITASTAMALAGFARGGKINRGIPINTGTVDNRLIAVNDTETVLTARHVAMLGGSSTMRKIRVPGYADGGYAGQVSPEIPSMGFDYQQLANMMNAIQVRLDVNKLNNSQAELDVITSTNRI